MPLWLLERHSMASVNVWYCIIKLISPYKAIPANATEEFFVRRSPLYEAIPINFHIEIVFLIYLFSSLHRSSDSSECGGYWSTVSKLPCWNIMRWQLLLGTEQPVSHLSFPTINSFPHAMLVSYYRGSWFASCLYSRYVAISDIVYFHTLIVWLSSSYVHIVHCCTSTVPYDIISILQHKPPHERLLWSLIRCVSQTFIIM